MSTLETLHFDPAFSRLPEAFYKRLPPQPLTDPCRVSFNPDAMSLIDLDPEEAHRPEFVDYFSGNTLLPGSDPLAMLYAGHQFGVYVPQLGDGRALLLGEVRNGRGERWDLQLKGSGRTPFSREGDGRAVLRSTIREYLCSEAMHGLGIPTTRALCIIGSDEKVYREKIETAAVLVRMAPSHVRFGSLQVFYYRQEFDELRILADYVIANHYPRLLDDGTVPHARFLQEVVQRTARLMALWQAVGFSHGVMNSDNMSIVGLTFDYGPFGFMDRYDPGLICNHSDHHGRYAFDRQPRIGLWNLTCLAVALSPLVSEEDGREALERYQPAFQSHYDQLMRTKLGLLKPAPEDASLVKDLLELLATHQIDYTIFFRSLGLFRQNGAEEDHGPRGLFSPPQAFDAWALRYRARLESEGSRDVERQQRMDRVNPKYVLRNYLVQVAIQKATEQRDYTEIDRLLKLLRDPYSEQPDFEAYAASPPDWAGGIQVSCSS